MPFVRWSKTSMLLFPIFYPMILLSSYWTYKKSLRKKPEIPQEIKRKVYQEQLKMAINPKILLDEHIFMVFEKDTESENIYENLSNRNLAFDKIM
jgi:superfamily II DNA or RNA helicase